MGTSVKPETNSYGALIRRVWDVELEILDVIDRLCRKHNICYSLMYGTLLGAVRHGGFIPWDDDIDLIMPRRDYDRFIAVFKQEAPEGYLLAEREMYPDYPNNFLKVVKAHSTFLQRENEREKSYPKGIFVDIFPVDRFAPEGIQHRIQFLNCMLNMLYTRGYSSNRGGAYAVVEKMLLSLPIRLREKWRTYTKKQIEKWNDRSDLPWFSPVTIQYCNRPYPPALFEQMTEMTFEGKQYLATKDYDTVMRIEYGDYMTLPPEQERVWLHKPVVLDFEHDLEELDKG